MEELLDSTHVNTAPFCERRVCQDVEILVGDGDCGGCAQEAFADGQLLRGHKQCGPDAATDGIRLGVRQRHGPGQRRLLAYTRRWFLLHTRHLSWARLVRIRCLLRQAERRLGLLQLQRSRHHHHHQSKQWHLRLPLALWFDYDA